MNRTALATRLSLLVALSGLLPILLVGAFALEVLRRRAERSSREGLQAVAEQAAARVGTYVAQQREMLRALAAALSSEPDAARRLAEVPLDAPSMGRLSLVGPETPKANLPPTLTPEQLAQALSGHEVASPTYLAADLTPAMDVCVPARALRGRAVCATFDLLELQRQVQRIRVGESGYALAFNDKGRLLAAGAGSLRAAVITGELIAESAAAIQVARGEAPPTRFQGGLGEEVLAGWATIADPSWTVAVEEPSREALRAARTALFTLGGGAVLALLVSLVFGVAQSRKMLSVLEVEERWRTAGLIASGITHDLGHRLAILQQTAMLAELGDPEFLPRIRDNLKAEVATLRKFVADFADLTRVVRPVDFLPLDLNAFVRSVGATAGPHAEKHSVAVEVKPSDKPAWISGDRYLLERATLNLVYNAIEASPANSTVKLLVDHGEGVALIKVQDSGGGIAADRLARLFDAFASTKRTGAHVGMGLPNVRRIIAAHGGVVSVESRLGHGSTFTIALPVGPQPT